MGRRGEFFGLREWREGDDRRGIHWRSTARTGRLMVREHEDELERQVTIVVDNALPARVVRALAAGERLREDAPLDDAVERTISHAASLATAYLEAGWAVGLAARGAQLPLASGRAQLTRVLRELALLPVVSDDTPIAELDPRHDRILCVPAEITSGGRPQADHVVHC
jgi:uncharacterized protein (DUF58 family)